MIAQVRQLFTPYFAEKQYALVYWHRAFRRAADSAIYAFTGAYFLKIGMPLPLVLFFFGLEFGLRGVFCPWGLKLISQLGIVKALTISAFFKLMFFVMMSYSESNIWIGFSSFIFYALAGGIFFPVFDVLEALFVKDDTVRGRQMSFGQIADGIAGVVGVGLFSYLLTHYSYAVASIPVALCTFLSVLPFLGLQKHMEPFDNFQQKDLFIFIKNEFTPYLLPLFGLQLTIIGAGVIAPIFIYQMVGQFDVMGILIAAAIIVELLVTFLFGRYVDQKGVKRSFRPALLLHSACMLSYIFLAKTVLMVFLTESLHKISRNFLRGSTVTGLHLSYRNGKKHLLLYGAGMQMTLCFFELLVLPLYALLSVWMGASVLYLAFLMSAVGVFLCAWFFWKTE
jgi:MFS family permease